MDYKEDFILEFARRTRLNLEFIEAVNRNDVAENRIKDRVFEVTQLANSLLGLLVFPKERYWDHIPEEPYSQSVNKHGWPDCKIEWLTTKPTLRQLVRRLRNGLCHDRFEFFAGHDDHVGGLAVWDQKCDQSEVEFRANLSISDLRAIAFRFSTLIESIAGELKPSNGPNSASNEEKLS